MNSPWGLLWLLQKETGWTDDYVLWGASMVNLFMKLSDAPYYKYRSGKGGKHKEMAEDFSELEEFLNSVN